MSEQGIRLLYIDDDAALVRLVQRTLGRRGFEVSHATSGEDALAHIEAGGVDVVALDHYLPTGTGLDLLSRLGTMPAAPAVVYVTGSAEMDVAVAALKAGASDFVPKTVGDEFLVLLQSALEQAVQKARLEAQKEAAEREVRAARDRAEMLLREVNHRVANSLSLVSSLVNLQANAVADQVAKDALAETQARIYAISLVHRRLYSSGEAGVVNLEEYLGGLLEHLQASLTTERAGTTLRAELAPVQVSTDVAVNLGVVVTELVTNAFKYAYPGAATGEIRVSLTADGAGMVQLAVADDGIGWSGKGPIKGTGLGARIVKAMALSLSAQVDYADRQPGTTVSVSFPADPRQQ